MNTDNTQVRYWTLETDEQDVAWLGLRGPGSANVLSDQVMSELGVVIEALYQAPPAGVVIYSHQDSGFIAGADVNEFPLLRDHSHAVERIQTGQATLDRLENLPCSSVAVLNGTTLGGGLELAMACSWRIGFDTDKPDYGLPEVQLGVHPGLGGTVRAPELMGVRAAMELMLKGRSIKPAKALRQGLIDRLTSAETWRRDAAQLATNSPPQRKAPLADRLLSLGPLRRLVTRQLRKQVGAKLNPAHYPAPFAMIDLWQQHGGSRDSFSAEAHSFAQLVFGSTSKNLVRIFFLQDRLKGMAKKSQREFAHVHVVGAGTMGADIAAWCAIKGISVTLQDREKQYVDAGLERALKSMSRKFRGDKKRIADASARLVGDHTGEGARSADLIIEAIFENLDAKKQLFAELERRARPDTLLASNTSSIPLEQIADGLEKPERLVGLHFFNPVARMPLIEVVQGSNTATDELDAGIAFAKQIGKVPLPCRGLPGFLVNRILAPYMDEAFRLYAEGGQPEAIDKLAVEFGMPVGPLELADSVGLDILQHVAEIVGPTIGRPPGTELDTMVAAGHLGEKAGQGFYVWADGKAAKQAVAQQLPPDSLERLMLSLVNEAAACVADAVVADADLCDAGSIFGSGFAPFRGGPLQYARDEGLDDVKARLARLEQNYGERFRASAGWDQLDAETK